MNWIERYVAQVKWYLPKSNRDDVAEELRTLVQDKAADREEQLGRSLNDEETFQLLKEVGNPLVVASAYVSPGPLVSEALLPLYWLTVRYMAIIMLSIYAVYATWYHLVRDNVDWPGIEPLVLINQGLLYFTAITLIFHFAGRYLGRSELLRNWSPARLPDSDVQREPLFSTIIVVLVLLIWFRLLSYIPVEHSVEVLFGRTGNPFFTFILWLKIQALLCLPVYLWLLYRPYWSASRRLLIMLADLAAISGGLIALTIPGEALNAAFTEAVTNSGEGAFPFYAYILAPWTLGVCVDFCHHGYRLWRMRGVM